MPMTTQERAASIDRRLDHALNYDGKRFDVETIMCADRLIEFPDETVEEFVSKLSEDEIDAYLQANDSVYMLPLTDDLAQMLSWPDSEDEIQSDEPKALGLRAKVNAERMQTMRDLDGLSMTEVAEKLNG